MKIIQNSTDSQTENLLLNFCVGKSVGGNSPIFDQMIDQVKKRKKENWIPDKTEEMLLAQFNSKYVLGFEDAEESTAEETVITVLKTWFNPEAFHSG